MTTDDAVRYDRTTIALHWATAALVVILWTSGQTADWLPRGPARSATWSTHVVLGFVLATVFAWRIVWRSSAGRALPAADDGPLHVLAKATHHGLYLLLATVLVLGVTNAFVRGYPIYDLFHLPQVGDYGWRRPITRWHGLAANAALALAGFHAAAALVHHYVLRDGLIAGRSADRRRGAPTGSPPHLTTEGAGPGATSRPRGRAPPSGPRLARDACLPEVPAPSAPAGAKPRSAGAEKPRAMATMDETSGRERGGASGLLGSDTGPRFRLRARRRSR